MEEKIIIYGAGDYGKRLWVMLKRMGIYTYCFCQTDFCAGENTLFGINILSMKELSKIGGVKIVLIAISNREISKQIKQKLLNEFLDNITIYECGEFIKINQNSTCVGERQYCIVCDSWIKEFVPMGIKEQIFQKYHIIGGGYRKNVVCPICYSIDRTRWCLYIIKKYTTIFQGACKVLHFAPEEALAKRIHVNENCDYYTCDLVAGKAAHIVDVTNIPFKNSVFDYIIINHVLEHIKDERQAVSEMKRVLKPEGKLIMSFPICMEIDTLECKSHITKNERMKMLGQEDHVRLYGRDYKEKIEQYGLKVESYSPVNEMSIKDIEKYGFIKDDIIMICTKEDKDLEKWNSKNVLEDRTVNGKSK